ncbi:MAG: ABC transporter substrate-binding protein [Rhodoblastus sp.]|jgi:branched-chain amino acid transport system substrate-binding protein
MIDRRRILTLAGATGASTIAMPFVRPSWAQTGALRVGLLLPYSGTYAALGEAITNAMQLYVKQQGGKLGGREIAFVKVDDASEPAKATENTTKLVSGEKVDVLAGTVHSGVAMAMAKIAKEEGLPTLIPNAGAEAITRAMCAPNIFRTSFGNSQVGDAAGMAMLKAGVKKAVTVTWKYAAGEESVAGFKKSFLAGGGQVIKDITLPFPDVEFQSILAEVASLKPDAVYSFFAGGGALKFMKDYAAAKLNEKIPLWGPGFLTDGVEQAAGAAGDGVKTALHYVESLDNPENKKFIADYTAEYKKAPDVYAVQGWDAMQLLRIGLEAAGGDAKKRNEMFAAMKKAEFKSPRGPFKLGTSHNPIQNFYLRELRGGVNRYVGVAAEMLADDTTGCKMA